MTLRENETEALCDSCCGPIRPGDILVTVDESDETEDVYVCAECWPSERGYWENTRGVSSIEEV